MELLTHRCLQCPGCTPASIPPTLRPFLLPEPVEQEQSYPPWNNWETNTEKKALSCCFKSHISTRLTCQPVYCVPSFCYPVRNPAATMMVPVSPSSAAPAGSSAASSIQQSILPVPCTHHPWRLSPPSSAASPQGVTPTPHPDTKL